MSDFAKDGFVVFDADPRVADWARAAHQVALDVLADPHMRAQWLRHGETWFVGVDALPNAADGSIGGMELSGPWEHYVASPKRWHRAQLSVIFEGYPHQDPDESDASHRFRVNRCAAHVDGLHLEAGRRIVREPHDFILGLPLNDSDACPLVVWRGSQIAMRAALREAIARDPIGTDVTDAYKAARAAVFDSCAPVEVRMRPGQAVLVDRFAVHGVAPWHEGMDLPDEGRMVAYFRPNCADPSDWLRG